uniref:Protein kish n=1 Tax=Chrysemys picta bellii TaxID=8478 RepID=A0A8C3HBD4_CHRPI
MTNAYSLDGVLVFGLLFVCTCAYFRKVPRLKAWLLSEKRGVWGVFYKGKAAGALPALGNPWAGESEAWEPRYLGPAPGFASHSL